MLSLRMSTKPSSRSISSRTFESQPVMRERAGWAAFQNSATFWIAMQSGSSLAKRVSRARARLIPRPFCACSFKRLHGSQQDIPVDENRHYQRSGFKLARLTASSESGCVRGVALCAPTRQTPALFLSHWRGPTGASFFGLKERTLLTLN